MAQPAQEQGSYRGPAGPWMQEVRSQLPALLGDIPAARWERSCPCGCWLTVGTEPLGAPDLLCKAPAAEWVGISSSKEPGESRERASHWLHLAIKS